MPRDEPRRGKGSGQVRAPRSGSATVYLAAALCLLFVTSLFDALVGPLVLLPQAPPLPEEAVLHDATLQATVVDEEGQGIAGASVRLFAVRDKKAYFVGEIETQAGGRGALDELPRGPLWVLAYAPGRARASANVILGGGVAELNLALAPAVALDVVVVDDADVPVKGAKIRVDAGDLLPHVSDSDAQGRARLDRLGRGPFVVTVRAVGFEPVVREVPVPVPLRVRLVTLGALEISVLGPDGAPVPGASVFAAGTGLFPPREGVADGAGHVRIAGLAKGFYDLRAKWNDLVSRTEVALPLGRGEEKSVTLTLAAGRHLAVTVNDGAGEDAKPVVDADVVVVEGGLSPFPLEGRTDEKGRVVLGPLARESLSLSAKAQGFVARSGVRVAPDEDEVVVALIRGGALLGEVVDDRGYPVDGATIEVIGVDDEGMPIDESALLSDTRDQSFARALGGPMPLLPMGELGVMVGPIPDVPRDDPALVLALETKPSGLSDPWVTRRDGSFRAAPIPPGRVQVVARHPNFVEGVSDTVSLISGGEASVRVVLREGGSIEGRVLDAEGRALGGARVEMLATEGSLVRVTYSADDGVFAFAAVPNEVVLSVARPEAPADPVLHLLVEVPARERKELEIKLPPVRKAVLVRVTDDRDYPLPRVEVRALALDRDSSLRHTTFTDDDGEATLLDAEGLFLRLTVVSAGLAPLVRDVEAAPELITIALRRPVAVRGTITARGGRDRVPQATIVLFTPTGPRHGSTDEEGDFVFNDLAPGRVRLAIEHEDYASREVLADVGGDPDRPTDLGEIDLLEGGEVAGEVVDSEGEPVGGARVSLGLPPAYLPLGPLPNGVVLTDKQGRFLLGGVPEGEVTIGAYTSDLGRGYAENVPVRARATTTRVRIELAGQAASNEGRGAGSIAVTLGSTSGNEVLVMAVPPTSEAAFAGIEPDDVIVAVNGVEVATIEEARRRMSGPLAEDVLLDLEREERPGEVIAWRVRVRRERVRR